MSDNKRLIGFLAIANKAGALRVGLSTAIEGARRGKACLLILASDASANAKKKMRDCSAYHQVRLLEPATQAEMGKLTGYTDVSAIAVCDRRFCKRILEIYEEQGGGE